MKTNSFQWIIGTDYKGKVSRNFAAFLFIWKDVKFLIGPDPVFLILMSSSYLNFLKVGIISI
jgi:hypothetical protein